MASRAPNQSLTDMVFESDSLRLSPADKTVLEFCRTRARQGKPVTQADITIAIGSQNTTGSTAAGILNRLVDKGLITRTYYQRGLQVCVDGHCTAPPPSKATHWRQRPVKAAPAPPIHTVRTHSRPLAQAIEIEARRANMPICEFLMQLVANGFELWCEREGVA